MYIDARNPWFEPFGSVGAQDAQKQTQSGRLSDCNQRLDVDGERLTFDLKHNVPRIVLNLGIAMADSVMLATAQRSHATLWTHDSDFDGLPGVKYYAKR
jgi:predicted nucleic acid-binding protein